MTTELEPGSPESSPESSPGSSPESAAVPPDRNQRRPVRVTYLVLAVAVVVEIVVQAVVMVWAVAGLGLWVQQGGVLDSSAMESDTFPFPEVAGFIVHGLNGSFIVPAIALALLVVSFFTRAKGAIRWAVITFVLIVLQGQLGYLGHEYPVVGALHGLNALITFTVALYAAARMRRILRTGADQAVDPTGVAT